MPKGLIVSSIGELYTIRLIKNDDIFQHTDNIYSAKPRGIFRKNKIIPLVGDIVEFEIIDNEVAVINKIYDRKNMLIRPNVANIDQLLIVMAAKNPSPDFLLIDKLLIISQILNIRPVICLNKIDLLEDNEKELIYKKLGYYEKIGYDVLYLSIEKEDNIGELANYLSKKVNILSGLSGVGKSTIINRIMNKETTKIGELSSKIQKGRHTTRNINLFEYNGGYIADTPGFCKLELKDMIMSDNKDFNEKELKYYYPEFLRNSCYCKFDQCNHISEPKCKIKELVEDGKIDFERYDRYKYLFEQLQMITKNRWK